MSHDAPPKPAHVAAMNRLTARWLDAACADGEPPAALSSVCVWPLLVALLSGAAGATRRELADACDVDATDVDAALRTVATGVASNAVTVAMGLWANAHAVLDPEWIERMPIDVADLSGDAEQDRAAVDAWVSRATEGAIASLPVDLERGDVDLLLAATLRVDTAWRTPFGSIVDVLTAGPWAGREAPVLSARLPGMTALRVVERRLSLVTVPGSADVDVVVALGEPDVQPRRVLAETMTALARGDGVAADALPIGTGYPGGAIDVEESPDPDREPGVRLSTVAFDVAADHDLLAYADVFGLRSAGDAVAAEFPGLSAHEIVYVSQAKQSCAAAFSAEGFHTAAVTAMGVAAGSARLETHDVPVAVVTVDRPFGYVAVHRPTGLVLVAGWVSEPAAVPADTVRFVL